MDKNQYKFTGSDESYTYDNLIIPLIPLIEEWKKANNKDKIIIWCPFDLRENQKYKDMQLFKSNYCKIFEIEGYKVITSHLATGKDFFEYEPKSYDLIISNPPFKNKRLFFERALKLNKPFALVSTMSWLNDGGVNQIFKEEELQLIIPQRRARFFNEGGCIGKSPSFKSGYFCKNFLINKQIKLINIGMEEDRKQKKLSFN